MPPRASLSSADSVMTS